MNQLHITTASNVSLITLQGCPTEVSYLTKVLEMVAESNVNLDMISLSPAQGTMSALSITVEDSSLGGILSLIPEFNKLASGIKTVISSGNCKISVRDPRMKNTPGIAAKIFRAASGVNADLRLVTTSEDEVSVLITQADFEDTLKRLQEITE